MANKKIVNKSTNKNIHEALMQRALGYEIEESSEEFSLVDKELVLTKRKVNKKTCPPDLSAIEMVLNQMPQDSHLEGYSAEELLNERARLIKLFNKLHKDGKDEKN